MSHNRARARAARAARTAQTTTVVPVDLTCELPVFGALLVDQPLPDEATWDVPDFVPWDDLLPPPPPRIVGTATSENRIVPVDDTAYTVQDAALLLDLLAGATRQIPTVPGPLLGLPQSAGGWRR